MAAKCYKCQTEIELKQDSDIGRTEECPSCHADLRCCKMCGFYDTSAYNDCKEPTADRILDKEKANFCDHFRLGGGKGAEDQTQKALDAANALFKK